MSFKKMKILIYFLIYISFKTNYLLIERNKSYYIRGKNVNFIGFNDLKKKKKLYISIDFGNYKSCYVYNFGGNNNEIVIGKMGSIPSVIILNKSNYTAKNYG